MSIKAALHHHTSYHYDRAIQLGPQVVRLRPAPHCRTPIDSYSLRVTPENHFINWQQDPHGNFLARIVFEEKVTHFSIDIDLIANLTVINPFDFFVEESAETFPFKYSPEELEELKPYLTADLPGQGMADFLAKVDRKEKRTIDFLVGLNQSLNEKIDYVVRMEPGVQSCEETLEKLSGSCRDSAWLLVQVLRNLGIAARFTSGYLIQLTPDVKSLDGPSGTEVDFTDLHAWTEAFLPGAGWVGLDPTSGLFTGEGHIPLASTPKFSGAAPISGELEECETEFEFEMSVSRFHEDPRVTKPYSDEQWQAIDKLGYAVDQKLNAGDVRLTMGGEPTFVSIDNPDDPQWQTEALGEEKNDLSNELMKRMKARFGEGPLLHYGQGKWYPGEPVPRWAKTCFVRTDGQPLWSNPAMLAVQGRSLGHTPADALRFGQQVAERLGVSPSHVDNGYEDILYHLWEEQRLPANVDLDNADFQDSIDRKRLARVLEQGLNKPVGCILPIKFDRTLSTPRWTSGAWITRAEQIFLTPGDSPMGFRLPLSALSRKPNAAKTDKKYRPYDPSKSRPDLLGPAEIRVAMQKRPDESMSENSLAAAARAYRADRQQQVGGNTMQVTAAVVSQGTPGQPYLDDAIPFAMCLEPRDGVLHIFMPPTDRLEQYLELLAAVEDTAVDLQMPVIIEGYKPPTDHRIKNFSITPDPGVIEVNVQPAGSWDELKEISSGLYNDAYLSRLGTEKFELDGTQLGTGGGNHVVLGGPTPMDSPLLRRPDLLRSLIAFWQNHPSLSYMFSGRFIGPTSQAPRVDEGRVDALYELQIAMDELEKQMAEHGECPPALADRIFRNLLIDVTGNTHRAEFCIDKMFSPDSSTGRLGLLEFRGFEMPPHYQMSLTQQLLLRTLVARFWDKPYQQPLVDWRTRLHDQFMMPHFVWRDFEDVIHSCQQDGFDIQADWFIPHFEFRFPIVGKFSHNSMEVELRQAIEPWNVLGEETTSQGTSRYVDSSVERMQVKVTGYIDERYQFTCNGRRLPLHPTEIEGQYVAGVRFRAWQPPSCLHPTIGVDGPLTFDVYDAWMDRSVDGCRYHVGHPGGLNPERLPINSYEAEGRRAARFSRIGHTGVSLKPIDSPINKSFPMTLDLRKDRPQ